MSEITNWKAGEGRVYLRSPSFQSLGLSPQLAFLYLFHALLRLQLGLSFVFICVHVGRTLLHQLTLCSLQAKCHPSPTSSPETLFLVPGRENSISWLGAETHLAVIFTGDGGKAFDRSAITYLRFAGPDMFQILQLFIFQDDNHTLCITSHHH